MSAALARVVAGLRAAAGAGPDAVAAALAPIAQDPDGWQRVFRHVAGADERGVALLHADAQLTLVHVDLAPGFRSRAHDHGIGAAIAVYAGQEDNTLYARDADVGLRIVGRVAVPAGTVFRMGADAIHHIENPLDRPLRAVHAYFGDLRTSVRHRYEPPTWAPIPEGGAAG